MPCSGLGSAVWRLGANHVLSGPQLEIWTNPLSRKGLSHMWGSFQGSCSFVHPGLSPSVKGRVFQTECYTTRTRRGRHTQACGREGELCGRASAIKGRGASCDSLPPSSPELQGVDPLVSSYIVCMGCSLRARRLV